MKLTDAEQAMYDGREGPARQKAMDLLMRYGEALGAERLVETNNVAGAFNASTPSVRELVKKGFDAVAFEGERGRVLNVEVRLIDYSTDMEFWKGIVKVQAELGAVVPKDGTRFEQVYFAERTESTAEAPRAKTNERLINSAISGALQKMFDDPRLMAFLAE